MDKRVWKIWIEKGRIALLTDGYDPAVVSNIKIFLPTPRNFHSSDKTWHIPLMWESCLALRQLANRHDAKLEMSDELRLWAMAEKLRLADIPDVNSFDKVELKRLADHPDILAALESRPFQTVGAKFIATAKNILIADHPGLGKTLQTIAGVIEAGITGPILVVAAPKSAAVITWPNELKRWVPGDKVITISGVDKPDERRDKMREVLVAANGLGSNRLWVITSPNYVRMKAELDQYGNYVKEKGKKVVQPIRESIPEMFEIEWGAVVADESHKTLAVATGNRKKWSAQRIGLDMLKVRSGGVRIAISGTPARGKRENFWGTLNWLRPDLYNGFWKWAEKHFQIYSDGFSDSIIGEVMDLEKFYGELKSFMIRRTKAEVAPDLPPKMYGGEPLDPQDPTSPVAVWLPMDPKQAKLYKTMVSDAMVRLESGILTANGVLAELTRLKQIAGSAGDLAVKADGSYTYQPTMPSNKFDWIVDFLSERGIGGENQEPTGSVIIASQFTGLLNMFNKELNKIGVDTFLLTGETSEKNRVQIQEEFQNGVKPVILLNTNAGGASITLDRADDVVILDDTWNKDDEEQVEDRAHRLSNTDHQVTIWRLRSRGTIEEGIAIQTTDTSRSIKSIIDGQRGQEFALELLRGAA